MTTSHNNGLDNALPCITIITPVWNGLPFLREAANSVLSQACQNWEWIVSDDGSSDGSRAYLLELQAVGDDRIKVFLQDCKLGIFGNLNFLCQRSTSELILILCQDDYFASRHTLTLAIDKWRELDPTVGAARWNSEYQPLAGLGPAISPANSQLLFFLHGNLVGNLSNLSFRKSAWNAIGPFEQRFPYAGDFYYWALLGTQFSIALWPENGVFVRSHQGQASNHLNQRGELYQQLAEITSEIYSRIPRLGLLSRLSIRIAGTLIYDSGYRRGLLRLALIGNPALLKALADSSPSKGYILSPLTRWCLFILTVGGLIGKQMILIAAWRLNRQKTQ